MVRGWLAQGVLVSVQWPHLRGLRIAETGKVKAPLGRTWPQAQAEAFSSRLKMSWTPSTTVQGRPWV